VKILDQALNGVVLLEPTVFEDERGSFYESFNSLEFKDLTGFDGSFVQDNHSTSLRSVLRGVHYQHPNPQGKLVRCVQGQVWDVAVDLRRSSPSSGQWCAFELSAANRFQLWIPEGFGHGFLALSDVSEVIYKATEYWDVECDRSILWNDPDLAIEWPIESQPILSKRDSSAKRLKDAVVFD
jgi:dTDP-4-dehydrorhamnose 3,5-epimerase